ncbi:TOBE domain-containing protein [Haloparvum sedimenti]|uniref:TOBE domain-containing protein n=1 Tax=Haloparvum sedimenti TaxID=1678448 RepID=UPI00071E99FC|nr:TOBE domain-containing protein [Haloparvum sedimenti]
MTDEDPEGEPAATARATLRRSGIAFDADDAALLRAVAAEGSVAGAAATLGRSRARALARLETLEGAFGSLVERTRGGAGGGGSRLTDRGEAVLARFDRLERGLLLSARAPETALDGEVVDVDGELASVATVIGDVRALHDGLRPGDAAQVRVGADAVTLQGADATPAADETSARNRFSGTVAAVERGETVATVRVRVAETDVTLAALVTVASADRLALEPGRGVTVSWKATATAAVAPP